MFCLRPNIHIRFYKSLVETPYYMSALMDLCLILFSFGKVNLEMCKEQSVVWERITVSL